MGSIDNAMNMVIWIFLEILSAVQLLIRMPTFKIVKSLHLDVMDLEKKKCTI